MRSIIEAQAKKILAAKGWRLLTPYRGASKGIELEDADGNRWKTTPKSLKEGYKSPIEKERDLRERNTMKFLEVKEIAKAKGGRVISEAFLGGAEKIELEDSKGRRWSATPQNIIAGSWSPFESREASGKRRKAIIPSKLPPEKVYRYYAATDYLVFIHGPTRDALDYAGFKNGEAKRAVLREALMNGILRPGYNHKRNYLTRVAFLHACRACSIDAEKLIAVDAERRAAAKPKKWEC